MKKKFLIISFLAVVFSVNGQTLQKSTLIDFCNSYLSTSAPDANSNYWNNINTATAGYQLALVDKTNTATNNTLQLIGAFGVNGGAAAGGLMTPENSQLGDLAIASATGDYFYTTSSSFKVYGLNINKRYKFYIFGSRLSTATPDTRETKYSIVGLNVTPVEGTVATTGIGIGTVSGVAYNGNTGNLFTSTYIQPDASGVITISVTKISGSNAYLNCMKMEEYKGAQTISFGALSDRYSDEADYNPGATASSGYAVSYSSSNVAVATIVSGQIHLVGGVGSTTITASQAGDATYDAAANVTQTLNVAARPVITVTGSQDASIITNTYSDVVVPTGTMLTLNASKTVHGLTIESGGKVTDNLGATLTATNFTIHSDVNGTGTFLDLNPTSGLNVSGTTNVNQYITSLATGITGRNWYISSPVSAAVSSTITTTTGNGLVSYNVGTGLWDNAGTTMEVMKGYIAKSPNGNHTIVFGGGTLNTGSQSVSNLPTGFNLVGNPYPSYLNWTSATKTNVSTSIWYRSKSTGAYLFQTYNVAGIGTSVNGGTDIIPPMQSFWVKVTSATNSLGFTNTMRSHQDQSVSTNRLKVPAVNPQQLLRLQVSNRIYADETVIYFNANAQDGIDEYDSEKMHNNIAAIPEIYTKVGDEHLVINGLSEIPYNIEMPLGFCTGEAGTNFTIKVSEMNNFNAGMQIILKDYLNPNNVIEKDLTNGSTYTFASDVVLASTRFSILFKSTSIFTSQKNAFINPEVMIYKNANNHVVIDYKGDVNNKNNVIIYNGVGQKLVDKQLPSNITTIDNLSKRGVYFVTVDIVGNKTTRKLVIN